MRGEDGQRWCLLIHQLPPRPLYLRAKVRNRLARVGALPLKNSVYVLPDRPDCVEDLQWIAQEAVAGGGEAFVCRARFLQGVSDEALAQQFRRNAAAAYDELRRELAAMARGPRPAGTAQPGESPLARYRRRLAEVGDVDFFAAAGRKEVETMLEKLETRARGRARGGGTSARGGVAELIGRAWVTRRDPKIDRLSTAWLVRRFVDPAAKFRFIDPEREAKRPQEIAFDMAGGDFTHEADRCTFETLAARLGLADAGVRGVGEIVHDIDLKETRYGRPETEGIRRLVEGIVRRYPDPRHRLERALALFDDLHASLAGETVRRRPSRKRRA
ncbi:MAG TPA: chromate resistance protein ChrB domain-containing protein [Vicinamibacteria bacterium]|jgi:hypothetical protein|nr:chromate resistance protein ChrB domain-containing protein [Vicinamibacteria bacterium]